MKQQQVNVSDHSNTSIITDYLQAMQVEINSSKSYTRVTKSVLTSLSGFQAKPFSSMQRNDIITFFNSLRKSEDEDPMHKWIGTYNSYHMSITRFFKWFEHPDLEPSARPKPQIMYNIPRIRRKEVSLYKPSDLWTLEDDILFLRWCPKERDRCYHAISRDLSARPHEILNLKIKDIVLKSVNNKQYAEVLVNGKTGSRQLPLIDSLPYIKQWLDCHPFRNNREAYFICSLDHRLYGKQLQIRGLQFMYERYKKYYFPKLLKDSTMSKVDKQHIQDLLRKPWNPYITQKSKYLKEHILRQHAGWSPRSQMHLKYVHYFGNESSESILQEYGILPRDNQELDLLKPKQCPNCNEPNRPDQKFCAKCRMVLTYDAYNETLESEKQKQDRLENMDGRLNIMQSMIEKLVLTVTKTADQERQTELVKSMYESGWLRVPKNDSGAK